jgi:hypothetical protein
MLVRTTGYPLEGTRHTDGPVKTRWATAAYTVFPEGLDGAFFDSFVARKACKIVTGEIEDLLASIEEFGPGSIRPRDHWDGRKIRLLFRREWDT